MTNCGFGNWTAPHPLLKQGENMKKIKFATTSFRFQAVKSCVAKWKGSTWFNMVQHGSTTFCSLIIAAVVVTECH